MEEKSKLGTLDAMTKESFTERPEQAPQAVEEYLENLAPEAADLLAAKLKNSKYMEQFKVAITHTSLMVFIAAFKAVQPDPNVDEAVEFEQYVREYLFFARQDDQDLYTMRLFYLNNLNAAEMGIGEIPAESQNDNPVEEALLRKEVLRSQRDYDNMINSLKKKYTEKNAHLV